MTGRNTPGNRQGAGGMAPLGKLLRWVGADNQVSDIFYMEVIQEVLLFGSESWALFGAMIKTLESTHVGFL